jgi:PspC domain
MRVDPERTLKQAGRTLNRLGTCGFVRQDEGMPTPYERPVSQDEARAEERHARRRTFTRPVERKVLAGVCSGLAAYFGWPLWLVRVAFVVASIPTGAGLGGP